MMHMKHLNVQSVVDMPKLQFKYNQICKEIDIIYEKAQITRADLIKIDVLTRIKNHIQDQIVEQIADEVYRTGGD